MAVSYKAKGSYLRAIHTRAPSKEKGKVISFCTLVALPCLCKARWCQTLLAAEMGGNIQLQLSPKEFDGASDPHVSDPVRQTQFPTKRDPTCTDDWPTASFDSHWLASSNMQDSQDYYKFSNLHLAHKLGDHQVRKAFPTSCTT